MKTTIVTGADATYYPFLADLLDSIQRCQPASAEPLDICVFDVGLSPEQRATIESRVTKVVEPGWDFQFSHPERMKRYQQAQIARPHLPRHFPQYDRYVWLDADLWLQDWRAIELLLQASEKGVMAIVPELHQGYRHMRRQNPALEKQLKLYYEGMFGPETGRWLATLPVFNSGVLAMRKDTVYWQNWSDVLGRSLNKFGGFLTEQCALNMAIYTGLVEAYSLPAWCNWVCSEALPVFDTASRTVHSPLLPHERISILHLVNVKDSEVDVKCMDDTTRHMALTYSGVMKASP